jgi:hypothetical protein
VIRSKALTGRWHDANEITQEEPTTVSEADQLPEGLPPRLDADIKLVCEMMLRVHYYEEASWLSTAAGSPPACSSVVAQDALRSAAGVSRQFGFPQVARWLEADILRSSEE